MEISDKKMKFFQVEGWWGSGRVSGAINLTIATTGVGYHTILKSRVLGPGWA